MVRSWLRRQLFEFECMGGYRGPAAVVTSSSAAVKVGSAFIYSENSYNNKTMQGKMYIFTRHEILKIICATRCV